MAIEQPDDGSHVVVDRAFYEAMSRDQLIARLKVAEDALTLMGWSAAPATDSDRAAAASQMWMIWAGMVGSEFTGPSAHPDLVAREGELAAARRRTAADTLARIDKMMEG